MDSRGGASGPNTRSKRRQRDFEEAEIEMRERREIEMGAREIEKEKQRASQLRYEYAIRQERLQKGKCMVHIHNRRQWPRGGYLDPNRFILEWIDYTHHKTPELDIIRREMDGKAYFVVENRVYVSDASFSISMTSVRSDTVHIGRCWEMKT